MKPSPLDAYLSCLDGELRKYGLTDKRVIDEVREHLLDSIRSGLERGLSAQAAEYQAFSNFGSPGRVAAAFVEERKRMNNRLFVLLQRMLDALRRRRPATGHYHDLVGPSSHFAVRLRRPWRNRFKRISATGRFIAEIPGSGGDARSVEPDPRERLVRFLREFARRKFDSRESLESLTLLEHTMDAAKQGGRYLAGFSGGTRMVWTVALAADGSISFHGISA